MPQYSLSESLSLKVSALLLEGLTQAAALSRQDRNDFARQALATAVTDAGVHLPDDCPESITRDWPADSANAAVKRKIEAALPLIRAKMGAEPYRKAEARAEAVLTEILEGDDTGLADYAWVVFHDHRLSPLLKLRYVQERIWHRENTRQP